MANFSSLKQEIRGKILTPSDKTFYENEINRSWNAAYRSRRPLAIVKASMKEDVQKAVKFCLNNEIEICVSCGGTSEFCLKDDAVIIDLSGMRKVQVDVKNKTAIVEGGAKIADVDDALHPYGFVLPLGSFSQLGVAGLTLIGGAGFLSRHFGMASDSVLEYDLVLANGDSIKVNKEENPELFWGMKGYGSNFGIVTSMKFKVHEIPNQVVGGMMFFQFSRTKDVVRLIRDYTTEANDNCLSIYTLIQIGPTGPELIVRLCYSGTIRRGGEIVQDLVDLTRPYRFNCGPVDHVDFQKKGDFLLPSGRFYYTINGSVHSELSDAVIDNVLKCLQGVGADHFLSGSLVYMSENFGGKDSEVDYEESSVPFRKNARYWVGLNAATKKEKSYDDLKAWADNFQNVTSANCTPFYDGGNVDEIMQKLKDLKQQYDPNNVFHNNLVPIAASE